MKNVNRIFQIFFVILKTMSHVCQNQTDDNDASRSVQRAYTQGGRNSIISGEAAKFFPDK